MDIKQDITTLKEQGVSDHDLSELLVLKGRKEQEIQHKLEEFYSGKNATQYKGIHAQNDKKSDVMMLEIIAFLLIVIAAALGYFIYSQFV